MSKRWENQLREYIQRESSVYLHGIIKYASE